MKGIIVAVFSLLSILLGIVCALKLSGFVAGYLLKKGWANAGWASVISYAIVFTAVLLLTRWVANIISFSLSLVMLGWADKLIGGLLYAFAAAVIWSSILWLSDKIHFIEPSTKQASKTYSYFMDFASWVYQHIGILIPFVEDALKKLNNVGDTKNLLNQ